jgi:hypothetical protein
MSENMPTYILHKRYTKRFVNKKIYKYYNGDHIK